MAGRKEAPVRVSARVRLDRSRGPRARLSWRFVDGRQRTIRRGEVPLLTAPAPEDRLETVEGPGRVSEPTAFYLWPPPGAQRLLFTSDRPAVLSVASPGFDPAVAAEPEPADGAVLLRYAPGERRPFYALRPANAEALRPAGRIERFQGAFRLERPPAPEKPPGAPQSLAPARHGGRFALIEPLGKREGERRPGRLWEVRREREETITVPQPSGASRGARVPATLHYEVERLRGPQLLTVRLDGKVLRRASVLATRGQLALPPLPVGKHRLRVDLRAAGSFFLDHPVAGASTFRKTQVFALPDGVAQVAVAKGSSARSLGVVVYLDGPPPRGEAAEVEAIVDGGTRRRKVAGGSSRFLTRLRRRTTLQFQRAPGAIYLNRAGGEVWVSDPIFFRLGDDLTAGSHLIGLRLRGLGALPAARFFSYGGPALSRINQHIEMRAEVSP